MIKCPKCGSTAHIKIDTNAKANLIQILVNAKCNSCGCKFILGYETDDYFKVREIK